jgi:uncharacterized protein (TIGR02996 family)
MNTAPEQSAFIAAIVAAPDDGLPRLVFADWLDENGQGEWAEFIRIQIEMAKVEAAQGTPDFWMAMRSEHADCVGCSYWCRLRYREAELMRGRADWHIPDLVNLIPHWARPECYVGSRCCVWERGFVTEVRCRVADWCGCDVCQRCDGYGRVWDNRSEVHDRCHACFTTGRTHGIGLKVVAAHPVTRVALTDMEAAELHNGRWSWGQRTARGDENQPDRLPIGLFRVLIGEPSRVEGESPYPERDDRYTTREDAHAALSDAAITWARLQTTSQETT